MANVLTKICSPAAEAISDIPPSHITEKYSFGITRERRDGGEDTVDSYELFFSNLY